MRLCTALLIVFFLQINWTCGDSTTIPSQLTDKSVAVENNPKVDVERSSDGIKKSEPNVTTNMDLEQKKNRKEDKKQPSTAEVGLHGCIVCFV